MKLVLIAGTVLVILGLCYLSCLSFLDQYHVGLTRNLATGAVTCDTRGGFHFSWPWVQVSRIDTRPARVCLTSASKAFNCKLVKFEPRAFAEFIRVQGFQYYWWANRLSFNSGYNEEYRGMRDLLRGYAFGIKQYPFVTTLEDYSDSKQIP